MPAVVALPAILIALMAMLLIYTFSQQIENFARFMFDHVPVVGKYLAQAAEFAVAVSTDALVKFNAAVIRPLVGVIVTPVLNFVHWLEALQSLAESTAGTITHLATTSIPHALDHVEAYALARVHAAEHALRADIDHVRSYAVTLVHGAEHDLERLFHRAESLTYRLVHGAIADLHKLVGDARHYALSLVHAAEHAAALAVASVRADLTHDVQQLEKLIAASAGTTAAYVEKHIAEALGTAESYAVTQVGVLSTDIDHAAATALAATWPRVAGNVKGLEDVIGGSLDDVLAGLGRIPLAAPTSLVGALAGVGAIAVPLLRLAEDCVVPNCQNLSQFGRDLQALFAAMATGGLLALFIELCTDPEAGAQDVQTYIVPVMNDAIDSARSLIGV